MKTKVLALFLLAGGSLFAGTRVFVGIGVGAPAYRGYGYYAPPPVVYAPPVAPGYSWVDGYWYPVRGHYYWRSGYWSRPYGVRPLVGPRYYDRGRYRDYRGHGYRQSYRGYGRR